MKSLKSFGIIFLLFTSFFLFACDGGGGGSSSGEVGTVSMSLTDAMSNEFNAVCVTINDVQVHMQGNGNGNNSWQSVGAPNLPKTFNLYDLTNGVREEIGIADLKNGEYTQMRLIIGTVPDDGINELSEAHPYANYVIDTDDNYQELKIPSGINTGIKIVHGFTISPDKTTELILDFNAEKSVVVAGDSGNWHLKPTIKCGSTEELSIIRGRVTTDGSTGIDKALVSVQEFDGKAADEKDKVTIHTSTVTDPDGYFAIFVSPLEDGDEYNLVIYADGKVPEYKKITTLIAGKTLTFPDDDIQLGVASTKNVESTVTITGGDNIEQFASLSFRQDITGQDITGGDMIEVTSVDVLNTEGYDINLPVGSYSVVAWTLEFNTQTSTLEILESDTPPIEKDIDFPES
jgi:hypothetical protein